MDEKEPYIKPKITLFDLTIETLSAQCCTTENMFAFTTHGHPACSAQCCEEIVTS